MAQISLPHQLTNGTVADASQVMANFNAIVDVVNGNLGADNLANITGSDITVPDLNGGTISLNEWTKRFQVGSISTGSLPPNDEIEMEVTFPQEFPGAPYIILQERTQHPGERVVTYFDPSKTGFTLFVQNKTSSASSFTCIWLAIYTGAV